MAIYGPSKPIPIKSRAAKAQKYKINKGNLFLLLFSIWYDFLIVEKIVSSYYLVMLILTD